MKKLTLALVLAFVPYIINAQFFDKIEKMNGVDSFLATKQVFKMASKIDLNADSPEAQAYLDLIKNLEEVRVLSTSNETARKHMAANVSSFIKNEALVELMRVTEDGKTVKFYSKPGRNDNFVSHLFMYMEGMEKNRPITVIMSVTGDVSLAQVSKLAEGFKFAGSNELKNIDAKKL